MTKDEYAAAKWRCKQALDLIGDALLVGVEQEDLGRIEGRLACAIDLGGVSLYLRDPSRSRLAKRLVKESNKREAKTRLKQARATLKTGEII